MMEAELLPCPFCGGEAEMSYYTKAASPEKTGYYVECGSCSAGGEPFDIQGEMPDREGYTQSKAMAAWNTRPSSAETVKAMDWRALKEAANMDVRNGSGFYGINDGAWMELIEALSRREAKALCTHPGTHNEGWETVCEICGARFAADGGA